MSAPLLVRPATAAELPALRALIESAYRGDAAREGWTHEADLLDGQRTDLAALAEILADPDQALLVAEEGGQLVGCVRVARTHRAGRACGYLGMLTVAPRRQRGGLGRRLVAEAEQQVAGWGLPAVEMTVIRSRRELVAWYERRGYVETGREEPFPVDDARFGVPKVQDLVFSVLAKELPVG